MVLSVTGMLVDFSVTVMQVIVSVATVQLEIYMANMWVAIFTVIMQMRLLQLYRWYFCSALCLGLFLL